MSHEKNSNIFPSFEVDNVHLILIIGNANSLIQNEPVKFYSLDLGMSKWIIFCSSTSIQFSK